MSKRFQKKPIYLLVFVAAMFVFVVVFFFLPEEETFRPWPWEAQSSEPSADRQWEAQSGELPVEAPGEAESSVNENAQVGATIEQQSTEAKTHTPEEMGRFIDRMGSRYSDAQKYLSQADVPALLSMLDDRRQIPNWGIIAGLLGHIDKEEASVDGLIDFIQRDEDWASLPHSPPNFAMVAKADAIRQLGFIGGESATDALRMLITEGGADQFLSEWIHDEIPGSGGVSKRTYVRGRAAKGLVYTQEAANIRLVEDLYKSVLPQVRVIDRRPGARSIMSKYETDEELYQCKLYIQAVDALAARDFIESRGIEEYKSRLHDQDLLRNDIFRHLATYDKDLKE